MKYIKVTTCEDCWWKSVHATKCLHPSFPTGGRSIPTFNPFEPLQPAEWCPLEDLPDLGGFDVTCEVVDTEIKLFGRPKYSDRVKGAVERIIPAGCIIRIGMLAEPIFGCDIYAEPVAPNAPMVTLQM